MTGYCSLNEQVQLPHAGSVAMTIELKTLNGRFFEVVAKLPSSMSHLELPINALLQEKLTRGRVYINVRIDDKQHKLSVIEPSWYIIDQYFNATQSIKAKYNLSGELTIANLISMPDVFVSQEGALSPDDEKIVLAQVEKAAEIVMRARMEEGSRLEKDFEKIFRNCTEKIAGIESNFNEVIGGYKEQLRQLLSESSNAEPQNPLIDELQVILRKIDIHEEITRFKSHLASVGPVFKAAALEKGKRLDFILQELLRETNTMMAKCAVFPVSSLCIDIKVELEKAREQVQNIV